MNTRKRQGNLEISLQREYSGLSTRYSVGLSADKLLAMFRLIVVLIFRAKPSSISSPSQQCRKEVKDYARGTSNYSHYMKRM